MQSGGKPPGYLQRTCHDLLRQPPVLLRGEIALALLTDWLNYPDSVPAVVSLELAETLMRFLQSEKRWPREPVPETERVRCDESQAVRTEALAIRLEAILTRAAGKAARLNAHKIRDASVLLRGEAAGLRGSCQRF